MSVVWLLAARLTTPHCPVLTSLLCSPSPSSLPGPARSWADLHSGGDAMEGVQKGAQKEAVLSLQRHTSKLSPTLPHPPSIITAGHHGYRVNMHSEYVCTRGSPPLVCVCATAAVATLSGSTAPAITLCTLPPHRTKGCLYSTALFLLVTSCGPHLSLLPALSPLHYASFPAPTTLPSPGVWLNSGWSL